MAAMDGMPILGESGYGKVELTDLATGMSYAVGTAVLVGVASISFYGRELSATAFSVSGIGVSFAAAVAVASLVVAIATNNPDLDSMEERWKWVAVGTAALHLGIVAIPSVESFVTSSAAVGTAAMGFALAGYFAVAWMG